MFSYLETKGDIVKAQRTLEATIRRDFRKKAVKNIGYPGGTTYDATVYTNGTYWFWSHDANDSGVPNPRRFNWFGLFQNDFDLQISVEINTPYEGRNDSVAGFFARDNNTGSIYLIHSGRVGGGTKGVGKASFLAWSGYRPIKVVDSSGAFREGLLVMPIQGIAATRPAIRYIDIIAKFKIAVREGVIDTPEFQTKKKELEDFYSESSGRRKGKRSRMIDYLSRHGDIVDVLHTWRKSKSIPKGGRLVKNVLIDLGVAIRDELVEVFEVKTSTVRSDLYKAIGQLMVHGKLSKCRKVLVLPQNEPIAIDIRNALKRHGIELLKFRLDEEKATIIYSTTTKFSRRKKPCG